MTAKREQCALQRVRMNVRHLRRLGSFEQHDWAMRTSCESRRLWKEPAIRERHREIKIRLALDHNAAINAIVTDIEPIHPYVEVPALSCKID